jgi:hypothetical protein
MFTTVNNHIADKLAPQCLIELRGISATHGLQLMRLYLNDSVSQEEDQMKLLLSELYFLPLAIVHAAAYIKALGVNDSRVPNITILHNKRKCP